MALRGFRGSPVLHYLPTAGQRPICSQQLPAGRRQAVMLVCTPLALLAHCRYGSSASDYPLAGSGQAVAHKEGNPA